MLLVTQVVKGEIWLSLHQKFFRSGKRKYQIRVWISKKLWWSLKSHDNHRFYKLGLSDWLTLRASGHHYRIWSAVLRIWKAFPWQWRKRQSKSLRSPTYFQLTNFQLVIDTYWFLQNPHREPKIMFLDLHKIPRKLESGCKTTASELLISLFNLCRKFRSSMDVWQSQIVTNNWGNLRFCWQAESKGSQPPVVSVGMDTASSKTGLMLQPEGEVEYEVDIWLSIGATRFLWVWLDWLLLAHGRRLWDVSWKLWTQEFTDLVWIILLLIFGLIWLVVLKPIHSVLQ